MNDASGSEPTGLTMVEAINRAIGDAMREDPDTVLLGEDVGIDGGVFRVTDGLIDEFGPERVRDTPISEALIGGLPVGLAAMGFKVIAEIQFMGFIYPVLDQLINHASRLRTRTRGRLSCPIVFRAPYGGGVHAPEHHSESMEALFAHIPGIRVVIPSSPSRAYGLLLAAIRDPDPVVFLEPKRAYRAMREPVAADGTSLPLDQCFVVRAGTDVTLVSWGAMLIETLEAAAALSETGIEAEVIDVASLKHLDIETILGSVEKTGRCVIVQEAPYSGGFGAEIAAGLAAEGLMHLLAPVGRVAGWDVVMPLSRLEQHYMPGTGRIVQAVRRTMEYS